MNKSNDNKDKTENDETTLPNRTKANITSSKSDNDINENKDKIENNNNANALPNRTKVN